MQDVFGVSDVTKFYVDAFVAAGSSAGPMPCYLSLGCGTGEIEIAIAAALVANGVPRFRFVCVDLSDVLLDRFRAAIPAELADHFDLVQGDLNALAFEAQFDAVMANHSLHHMVHLEGIFASVKAKLTDSGVFATSDMIGRNGHMRWPETRLLVDFFWPFMTERQRRNVLLQRAEPRFIDHDCSDVGFEGVRAQDILPLILRQGLHPWKFLGFGGGIDVFVDRCFGGNFDPANPDDVFLLNRIGLLNDLLLDAGLIKPTMMLAYFTKTADRGTIYFRNRTAQSAIRDTAQDPAWLAAAQSDFAAVDAPPEFVYRSPRPLPSAAEMAAILEALHDARAETDAARRAGEQHERRASAMQHSSSWQMTAPLRLLARLTRQTRANRRPRR